jgi:drug/metabolite transporter (DMT)-like permease
VAIVFSVLCALVYGAGDFCGGLASKRTATLGVVVVAQFAGLVLLLVVLPFSGGAPVRSDWLWGAVCGISGGGAVGLLYRGLAIGKMGIVSPTTAVIAAAVPILFGVLARGERPSWLAVGGIIAALFAVVCVSAAPDDASDGAGDGERATRKLPPGVLEALIAGTCFGAFFIALAQTRTEAGMYPLLAARIATLAILTAGAFATRHGADLRVARPVLAIALACGVLDLAANVLFMLAVRSGMISIVAVISSLYPASTVTLAAVLLGERLVRIQWIGVALALGGVAAISAAH